MHALEVGNFVQTNHQEQSFSRVLLFVHIDRVAEVEYLQFYVEHDRKPIGSYVKSSMDQGHEKPYSSCPRYQSWWCFVRKQSRSYLDSPATWIVCASYGKWNDLGFQRDGLSSATMIPTTIQAHASHDALSHLCFMCAMKFFTLQKRKAFRWWLLYQFVDDDTVLIARFYLEWYASMVGCHCIVSIMDLIFLACNTRFSKRKFSNVAGPTYCKSN
jgi:hypothetical protein